MKTDVPEQRPETGNPEHEVPQTPRSTRGQRLLFVIMVATLFATLVTWLVHIYLPAVLTFVVAVTAGIFLFSGTGSMRDKLSKGPGTVGIRQHFFRRSGGEPRSSHSQQGGPPAVGQGGPPQNHPPGEQGHPFAPSKKGQHRVLDPGSAQPAGATAPSSPQNAASPTESATALGEPPVFGGWSAPGQASWHLPIAAAPSGLAADGIRLGDLEVRAASMVGAGHRCQEPAMPRQDAYTLGRTKDGQYLVIAVADGVGNSKHADIAARVAVNAATRELVSMVESGGLPAVDSELIYTKVAGEIVGTGRNRGIPEAEVATILITAVIPTTVWADGSRPMLASWIGDVSLWIGRDEELHRMTGQDKTGLDRNALHAVLPFNPDQVEKRIVNLHPYDRVALMTDGVSDSLDSAPGALEHFARLWAAGPPPHPAAFLHHLCYDGPGQTDDRTAVVVWCGAGSPGDRRPARERR